MCAVRAHTVTVSKTGRVCTVGWSRSRQSVLMPLTGKGRGYLFKHTADKQVTEGKSLTGIKGKVSGQRCMCRENVSSYQGVCMCMEKTLLSKQEK